MPVRLDACSTVMAEILPSASMSSSVFSSRSRVSETGTLRNSIWRVSVSAKYRIFMAYTPDQRTRCEPSCHQAAVSHAAPGHRPRELEPNVESGHRPGCAREWAPEAPARSIRLGSRLGRDAPALPGSTPWSSQTHPTRMTHDVQEIGPTAAGEASATADVRFHVATDCRDQVRPLVRPVARTVLEHLFVHVQCRAANIKAAGPPSEPPTTATRGTFRTPSSAAIASACSAGVLPVLNGVRRYPGRDGMIARNSGPAFPYCARRTIVRLARCGSPATAAHRLTQQLVSSRGRRQVQPRLRRHNCTKHTDAADPRGVTEWLSARHSNRYRPESSAAER